jgi:predicted dehydrogenase
MLVHSWIQKPHPTMSTLTRRTFLRHSALAGATAAFSARSWSQVAGANSDIRVAVIGLNGRGNSHLGSLSSIPGVRIVALCDVDTTVLARAKSGGRRKKASTEDKTDSQLAHAKAYTDIRELLADKDVNAVTIATPNHWHALGAIWACQHGKDVYVEKPVSHNVWEGRQLVAAAVKYDRIVQCGTQIRSGEGLQEAVAWVRAGNLGKIIASRGFCYKFRGSIGRVDAVPAVPESVNFDLWSGPAPKTPPRRKRFHYDWHWQYLAGNGDVGNQGIHQMDVARWFLGESGLPRHTVSIGGRLGYVDDGETPNTQVVLHDYATAPLIFEVRGLPGKSGAASTGAVADAGGSEASDAAAGRMDKYRGVAIGNVIDCEGGSVIVPSYNSANAVDRAGKTIKEFRGRDRHMQNFIDCVRSRKAASLYGPIEEGHLSSALCHLGNISHVLGQRLDAEQLKQAVKGNAPLAEAYGRMAEHLGANGVDLGKSRLAFGAALTLEPGKERFTGEFSEQANRLLTRAYRAPFTVPTLA